jgi:hypothetical protein
VLADSLARLESAIADSVLLPPAMVLFVKVSVLEAAAAQPTFAALAHTIIQFEVESETKPLVVAAILDGSVPGVPNKYHPVPGVVIVGAVPVVSSLVNVLDQTKLELPSAMEFVVPGSRAALTATPVRLDSEVFAPLLPPFCAQ